MQVVVCTAGFPTGQRFIQTHGSHCTVSFTSHARGESALYTAYPVLMLVSACLKYPPARDKFDAAAKLELRVGRACSGLGVHGASQVSNTLGVPALFRILQATCESLDSVRMDAWTANCGRARASGFLPWLTRWQVLTKATGGVQLKNAKCVRLGQGGMLYRVMPLTPEAQDALTHLVGTHYVARAIQMRPSGPQCLSPRGAPWGGRGPHIPSHGGCILYSCMQDYSVLRASV